MTDFKVWYIRSQDKDLFHYVIENNKKITICNIQTVEDPKELLELPPKFRSLCKDCKLVYSVVEEMMNKYKTLKNSSS